MIYQPGKVAGPCFDFGSNVRESLRVLRVIVPKDLPTFGIENSRFPVSFLNEEPYNTPQTALYMVFSVSIH